MLSRAYMFQTFWTVGYVQIPKTHLHISSMCACIRLKWFRDSGYNEKAGRVTAKLARISARHPANMAVPFTIYILPLVPNSILNFKTLLYPDNDIPLKVN